MIVAVIFMLFLLNKSPTTITQGQYDFQSSIEKCVRDATSNAIDVMIPQGGFLQPENYKLYNNINVTFLCQNTGYFKPCINQHPLLINEEINEIENYTTPIINNCFSSAQSELESRNYGVSISPISLNVSFGSGRVYTLIVTNVTISKNGQTQTYDNFNVELNSPIYDLSKVAMDITNNEAKYCYFEYVGYMLLYPRWQISKFTFSDSTKIYTIEDLQSKKEMNIAVRGCAIPPGI